MFDGIGMGLGFTIALTLLGAVREFLPAYFASSKMNTKKLN